MHLIFTAMRFYPWWALPAAFVLFELGVYFRRKGNSKQFAAFGAAGVLVLTALLWFIFRGDLHSDKWVRALQGGAP